MTEFTNQIGRGASVALVPEKVSDAMLGVESTIPSATLSLFHRIPVTSAQTRFPVLSTLPSAYWVAGDTGLKGTTEEVWSNKFINIEEMAVIVPVPENVLADVSDAGGFDLWGEVTPDVGVEFGRVLDTATFFGTNAPSTFPTNINEAAYAAGNHVEQSAESILGEKEAEGGIQHYIDEAIGKTEVQGFVADRIVANLTLKGKLRQARSTIGERLTGVNDQITEYMGLGIEYPMRGLWPTGDARVESFIGDFSEFVLGVRKDITMKLLTEGVLQNSAGEIVANLSQQDMVALRFTFRAGWQVSNRIRYDQEVEAERYPLTVQKAAS